ncbi:hypothetical protein QUC31_014667 [Theobroma cacao]
MITALAKLDDHDGAEKIFGEWELQCTIYDLRMPKAVEMLKKAMSVGRRGWRPRSMVFAACLDYLEEQGDGRGMEEMICLLKNSGPLTRDM